MASLAKLRKRLLREERYARRTWANPRVTRHVMPWGYLHAECAAALEHWRRRVANLYPLDGSPR